MSPAAALAATVSAKIEDGNIRAAVRLICSEDKPAPNTDATFMKLQEKHPAASARTIHFLILRAPLPYRFRKPISPRRFAPFQRVLLALTDSDLSMLWIRLAVRILVRICWLLSRPSTTCCLMVMPPGCCSSSFWGQPHRFGEEIWRHQTDRHWLHLETHCL